MTIMAMRLYIEALRALYPNKKAVAIWRLSAHKNHKQPEA